MQTALEVVRSLKRELAAGQCGQELAIAGQQFRVPKHLVVREPVERLDFGRMGHQCGAGVELGQPLGQLSFPGRDAAPQQTHRLDGGV